MKSRKSRVQVALYEFLYVGLQIVLKVGSGTGFRRNCVGTRRGCAGPQRSQTGPGVDTPGPGVVTMPAPHLLVAGSEVIF